MSSSASASGSSTPREREGRKGQPIRALGLSTASNRPNPAQPFPDQRMASKKTPRSARGQATPPDVSRASSSGEKHDAEVLRWGVNVISSPSTLSSLAEQHTRICPWCEPRVEEI